MSILIEKFSSLEEYVSMIGKRSNNTIFGSKQHSQYGDPDFTGTASYEESVALIARGYGEGLNKMTNEDVKLRLNQKSSRALPASSPVGYAPIVPNAILGLPNSMMSKKVVQMKTKVISILYDISCAGNVSKSAVALAGRNVLELVNMLEVQGYRVELCVMDSYCGAEQYCFPIVKVKTDKQPMNPLKIAYPLLHSSYIRRQGFKWIETFPKLSDESIKYGYGKPLSAKVRDGRRAYLREKKVLNDRSYYTDYMEAKDNDAKGLMKLMGIK